MTRCDSVFGVGDFSLQCRPGTCALYVEFVPDGQPKMEFDVRSSTRKQRGALSPFIIETMDGQRLVFTPLPPVSAKNGKEPGRE